MSDTVSPWFRGNSTTWQPYNYAKKDRKLYNNDPRSESQGNKDGNFDVYRSAVTIKPINF